MLNFYKPNSGNTGSAVTFNARLNDGAVFVSMIKQASWDAENKKGSFEPNKGKPEATLNVKLSLGEAAAILDCIERNRPLSTVHKTEAQTININFEAYCKKDSQVQAGFSLRFFKKTSDVEAKFLIGFTFAEARLLREYLVTALQQSFVVRMTTPVQNKTTATPKKTVQPKQEEPSVEEQLETPAVDETDLGN